MNNFHYGILIVILVYLIPSIAFADEQSSNEILLGQAVDAIRERDYEKAVAIFDTILQSDPNNTEILTNKGTALVELQKYDEAILIFDKILDTEPNNAVVLNNKGIALVKLGSYNEAIINFDKVLETDLKNTNALKNRNITFKKINMDTIIDSKYLVHVQIQVRNIHGMLVSVTESNSIKYLPHPLTDEYLDSIPLKEIVSIDGTAYEKREIKTAYTPREDTFIGSTRLVSDKFGGNTVVFSTLNHGYTVERGDIVTALWILLRAIGGT